MCMYFLPLSSIYSHCTFSPPPPLPPLHLSVPFLHPLPFSSSPPSPPPFLSVPSLTLFLPILPFSNLSCAVFWAVLRNLTTLSTHLSVTSLNSASQNAEHHPRSVGIIPGQLASSRVRWPFHSCIVSLQLTMYPHNRWSYTYIHVTMHT